ncbi:16489_t:CDS:10, partial [Gigaspora rosea]
TRHIPELELTAIQLRHEATGAEHLHIARDDDNNVFGVGFSTPPMSSSGTPHILEHTTLCGSKKFPVRDPFFKMLNRSLANFMNAFTANDYTIYPFSTTHLLDYENLRDVYMDATFHPYLRELDFKQEGATPLQFKGVVYNEMKGQMSDAGYLYYSRVQQYMYPGTAYGYNSGGEPRNITDLTHQELLDFHKSHYHPSNAKFYTYGIKIIKPFDKPQRIVFQGPIDPMNNSEKQTKMSISFLTNDITDVVETFALRLFAYLLLDGHASPMYKALIDTNIGSDFSENTGYDSSTRISSLSIGLQGMKSQDIPLAEQTIRKVLEDIHRNGFDSKRIEAALHQTELGKKHNIEIIKERIKSEPFFQNLVEKYFLTNLHTLTCIMEPDPRYTDELSREEENRLSSKTSALSESEKNKIYEQSIELIQKQEAEEDLSVLPSLRVSDISREMRRIPLEHHNLENCPVQWRTTVTNGITYFRMISKIGELPDELKIYLPLFAQALTSLGTKTKTMAEIDDDIRLYTGGINASPFVSTNHSDIDQYEEGIVIASHCLDRNINQMYDIMQQLLRETNFDNVEKLRTMIYGNATNMMNSVVESGHAYAKTFAASRIAPAMANSEVYGGMTQVYFMNKLAGTEDFQSVINKLKEISLYLLSKSSLRVAITCGAEAVNQNEVMLKKFLPSFPDVAKSSSHAVERPKFQISHEKAFFPLPFAVNFSAKCFRGTPYTHPDGSKLQGVPIRDKNTRKNGAYGGGAVYSPTSGIFSFFSYRDPKTLETLETYKQAIDWVANRKFSQQEMDEAKLSIFQGIDAPISVAQEGLVYFEGRINDDMRQLRREQLLSVTEDDIKEAAKILEQQEHLNWSSVTIIGEGKPEILEDNKWK